MLRGLSIRDVVLIEKLDLTFGKGLGVLTGETGAGKSILLDALGLALGVRANPALIRKGAGQASVTAEFDLPAGHPAIDVLREQEIEAADDLILRRVLGSDGRSRAFINDQPVSVGLLKQVGDALVEIQGQSDQRGLLDPSTHRELLDAFGGLAVDADRTSAAWRTWRQADEELTLARAAMERAQAEESFLRHSHEELETLAPKTGEEKDLAERRAVLMHQEKIIDALNAALGEAAGEKSAEDALRRAIGALERVADKAGGRLDPIIEALERAAIEAAEAIGQLEAAGEAIDLDAAAQTDIDERLFALRDVARKHRVEVDALPALHEKIAADLNALDDQSGALTRLEKLAGEARKQFEVAGKGLSEKRHEAAQDMDQAVTAELPPLKLENAVFRTRVEPLAEDACGPHGIDRIAFEVATNPGADPGPIAKIASGGELSRFMLALKVVLSRTGSAPTIVFDEVDSGVGGATAHAVGQRLSRLGGDLQVLVVTHSPQVAARGAHHWQVAKNGGANGVATTVDSLDGNARREEIARMLSGEHITDEARAAADSLLAGEAV